MKRNKNLKKRFLEDNIKMDNEINGKLCRMNVSGSVQALVSGCFACTIMKISVLW
jgi:hypothetical protein